MGIVGSRAWVNDAGVLKRRAGTPIGGGTTTPTDPGTGGGTPTNPTNPTVPSTARTFGTNLGEYEGTVPSGALYVSPSGSDSATGSLSSPYATFEKALAVVPTGGTIVLRGGTSATNAVWHKIGRVRSQLSNGVAINVGRAGVTIMNAPGEAVGFDGGNVITGFTRDTTNGFWWRSWTPFDWSPQYTTSFYGTAAYSQAISSDDWTTLDGSDPGGNASQDIYWQFVDTAPGTIFGAAARPERVWINGIQLFQVDKMSLLTAGRFFIDAKTNRMWLGSDPTSKTVEATVQQKLFNFLATDQSMLGLGVRRYAGSQPMGGVIQGHRPRLNFSYNYCIDNAMAHVALVGTSTGIGAHDSQLNRNTFIRGKNIHVRGSQCDGVTLDGNLCINGNDGGFNPAPAAGAFKFTYLHDTTVSNNKFINIEQSDAPGIKGHAKFVWFDADVLRPTIHSNEFYNGGQRSVAVELTNDAIIFNNLDVNAGTESFALVDAGGSPMVWNNTSVGCGANRGKPETIVNLTFLNNGVIRTVRDSRYPRVRGVSPEYIFDKRYYTTQDAAAPDLEPFPSSGVTPRSLSIQNNVVVNANVRAIQYDEEQKSGSAGESYLVAARTSNYNLYQPADTFSTGSGFTNDGIFSLDSTVQQSDRPAGDYQKVANTITAIRALGYEANGQVYAASASDILDSTYNLKDSSQHANAAPLPAKLAALAGVSTGAKRFGTFVTGSQSTAPAHTVKLTSGTNDDPAEVAFLGDSITFGADTDGASSPKWQNSYPGRIATAIASTRGNGGTGVVLFNTAVYDKPSLDPRFTNTGTLTKPGWGYHKAGALTIPDGGTTPTVYREFTATCTQFVIYAHSGSAGLGRVSVDGGTSQTIRSLASGGTTPQIERVSGGHPNHIVTVVPVGSLAQHTIRIWGDGGTYTVWGIEGRTKAGTIRVSNTAISGRSLGSFMGSGNNDETTGRFGLPFLDTLQSDVVVIALGVNDWQGSTTIATFKGYLNTLISRVKAYGGVPVLYVVPQPAVELQPSGGPTWTQYTTAYLEVGAAAGVAVLNHQKLWASDSITNENDIWLAGVALGKYGSTNPATAGRIHPNDSGLADMGVNGYGTKQSIRAFLGI